MKLNRIAIILPLALIAAACGGSSKSSSSPTAASMPAANQSSASTPATSAPPVMITTKHAKLGTILAAGPKHLTVYLFEADKGPSSTCTGACAAEWPPVLGKAAAHGGAMSADLGTTTRPDGRTQVTYKGHPLYYYVRDKEDGDTYGQGLKLFGAEWYVLNPAGSKVDNS
jgi:predicted lipoprotein with Yx(FWY)xxD motif